MAAVIAVPFGLIALRVRRHTFVVITIAVFFIFQLMAFNLSVTGGTTGINAPFLTWAPATYNNPFYYLALIIAVGTVALSWLIRGSRFGLQLRAIRDDEDRAREPGRAGHAGQAGRLRHLRRRDRPGRRAVVLLHRPGAAAVRVRPAVRPSVALMAFLGGLGTVAGPVLGALILEPAQQYLTLQYQQLLPERDLCGALFLLVILFLPRGHHPHGREERRPGGRGAPGAGCGGAAAGAPGRRPRRAARRAMPRGGSVR